MDETEPVYAAAVKRITCNELALGYPCDRIFEAETDEEVLEQVLAHARDDHGEDDADSERRRALVAPRKRVYLQGGGFETQRPPSIVATT